MVWGGRWLFPLIPTFAVILALAGGGANPLRPLTPPFYTPSSDPYRRDLLWRTGDSGADFTLKKLFPAHLPPEFASEKIGARLALFCADPQSQKFSRLVILNLATLSMELDCRLERANSPPLLLPSGGVVYLSKWGQLKFIKPGGEVGWSRKIGANISAPVSLFGDRLIAGNFQGTVQCIELSTGAPLWQRDLEGPLEFKPVHRGEDLLLATGNGIFYCLELATGHIRYLQTLSDRVVGPPLVVEDKLYCFTTDGQVHALSPAGGSLLFRQKTPFVPIFPPLHFPEINGIALFSESGRCGIIDAKTLVPVQEMALSRRASTPLTTAGKFHFVGLRGKRLGVMGKDFEWRGTISLEAEPMFLIPLDQGVGVILANGMAQLANHSGGEKKFANPIRESIPRQRFRANGRKGTILEPGEFRFHHASFLDTPGKIFTIYRPANSPTGPGLLGIIHFESGQIEPILAGGRPLTAEKAINLGHRQGFAFHRLEGENRLYLADWNQSPPHPIIDFEMDEFVDNLEAEPDHNGAVTLLISTNRHFHILKLGVGQSTHESIDLKKFNNPHFNFKSGTLNSRNRGFIGIFREFTAQDPEGFPTLYDRSDGRRFSLPQKFSQIFSFGQDQIGLMNLREPTTVFQWESERNPTPLLKLPAGPHDQITAFTPTFAGGQRFFFATVKVSPYQYRLHRFDGNLANPTLIHQGPPFDFLDYHPLARRLLLRQAKPHGGDTLVVREDSR